MLVKNMKIFIVLTLVLILKRTEGGIVKEKPVKFWELKYINSNVDPCDNFYEFACGNFEKFHPKPDNELLWDNFKILQGEINKFALKILRTKSHQYDSEAVIKAKDMYSACVNENMLNEVGLQPLVDVINDLGGWSIVPTEENTVRKFSWELVGDIVAKYGLPMFFAWDIRPYIMDADINMIMLTRDQLVLPATANADIDYLPEATLFKREIKETYVPPYTQYLINVATALAKYQNVYVNSDTISKGIDNVMDVMLQIKNSACYPFEERFTKGYIDTIEDLQNWSDAFSSNYETRINWETFFNHVFQKSGAKVNKDTKVVVKNQLMLANILKLIEYTDPKILMDFITTRLLTYMAPDTDMDMWKEFNQLYSKLKYSVYDRDEYCMRKIASYPNIGMSLAVAHAYQNFFFNAGKLYGPEEMIDNLKSAFFELIDENNWMDEKAKEWVKDKASNILSLIGFPDFVYSSTELDDYYSKLQICKYGHFDNSQNIRAFVLAKAVEVIDKPRQRDLWTQSPLYVNAYYNQLGNKITIPAGIMNYPFYTGLTRLTDYSRLGALIGHELTHGFDSNGRQTDKWGTVVGGVWSKEVEAGFLEREKCFVEQYSNYYIDELKANVNGSVTRAENIADNGGLREAYRAFKNFGTRSVVIDNDEDYGQKYTLDQLFFLSYASMWCKIDTFDSLDKMYYDVHAPNRFRVIGTLSNMEEFSSAFNCPVGSKMNPEHKCVLW